MGRELQCWRSGDGEALWLSLLIDTMEEVSRPETRSSPCDPSVLLALSAKLARPTSPHPYGVSRFSCETRRPAPAYSLAICSLGR
jgi:hypothetical protein